MGILKLHRKIFTFSIIVIFVIGIFQGIDFSYAQENGQSLIISSNFQTIEFSDDFGIKENLSLINIDIPSPNWTVTEIDINFTSIKMGSETVIIEDGGEDSYKTVNEGKQCRAVQINITEPVIILAVEIYGYVINPQDEQMLVHINGYDSGTKEPNSTIYGSPVPLNMSIVPNWYKQTFSSPISLAIGYYYLVVNGTDIGNDKKPKYHWYNNDDNPTYPNLYIWEWDGSWGSGSTNECLRYKIYRRVDRDYNPEEINMTAEINGNSYNITDGGEIGTGILSITNFNFSPTEDNFNVFIKHNLSIELLLDFSYHISLKHLLFLEGSALIRENLDNKWTVNPEFTRVYSNYSIKFYYPKNWYNVTVYKNGFDITDDPNINITNNFIFISNSIITNGATWLISANSPTIDFTLNVPKTEFEPLQDLKFSVLVPVIQGNITYVLIDPLGFEEHRETKQVISQEILFSYNLSGNPNQGIYKAYLFWYNSTDAGVKTQEFRVNIPFTIPPEVIVNLVLVAIIVLIASISGYISIKRVKRIKNEHRHKIFNKYMDILNLNYFIVSDKNSGLTIYEQPFAGKELDGSLISGFLQAIRVFGIEITDADEQSRSIRLDYQNSKILMSDFKNARLILLMEENPSQDFLDSINALSNDIEEKYGILLEDFDGNITQFSGIKDLLEQHLHPSLIYPLKVSPQDKRIKSDEKTMINRALEIMKEKNTDYFFVSFLLTKKKGFQVRDAETILNLIHKKIFQPQYKF